MKRIVAILAVLACVTTVAFAQQKVGVYTTLEEPLAKELFDQISEGNWHSGQLAAAFRRRSRKQTGS